MTRKRYRHYIQILNKLIILSFVGLLTACGFSPTVAQEVDTTSPEPKKQITVEIEIGDEGVIVRGSENKKSKKAKIGIIIDDDKIMVDGSSIGILDLDSALKCITIDGGGIVKFGEDLTIEEDKTLQGDVVALGGDITVLGTVTGDVVALGGDITVLGTVAGDVVILGGDLYIKSTGTIKGDAVTVMGKVHQERGAEIRGQRVGVLPISLKILFSMFLAFSIIISLLLVILAVLLAPKNVDRICEAIELDSLKSALIGIVAAIVFVLLIITVIGIPVAFIAYFVAGFMGFAGISLFMGTKLHKGSGLSLSSPLAKSFAGAVLLELVFVLAWLFNLGGDALSPLFWLFLLIGCIIISVANLVGLGAAFWTRFGKRSVAPIPIPVQQTPPLSPQQDEEDKEIPEAPASG